MPNNSATRSVVRRATTSDAEAIAALTEAAYAKYVPALGRMPQPMNTDYRQVTAEHPVWLLCLDEQIAGVIVLMLEPEVALIYSVAVSPAHQGQGLGRRLMDWAEEQARQAGYRAIRLYTNEHMTGNAAWYARLGYEETRREMVMGTTVIHMAKKFPAHLTDEAEHG